MKIFRTAASAVALSAFLLVQTALMAQKPAGGSHPAGGPPPPGAAPRGDGPPPPPPAGKTPDAQGEPKRDGPRPDMGPGGREGRGGDPTMRTERLAKTLDLTDAQKAKCQTIFENEQKQTGELRNDTTLTPEQRMAKMAEIRNATNTAVRATLTEEQQKKFDENQQRMKDRMKERGPDGPPPPPPPKP